MPEWGYLAAALASAVAATVTLRALPFALRGAFKASPLLADLNVWMPLGVTVILAVYCLSGIDLHNAAHAIPQVAGVAATVIIHWWQRNLFLSIVSGTLVCVVLANWVVPGLI